MRPAARAAERAGKCDAECAAESAGKCDAECAAEPAAKCDAVSREAQGGEWSALARDLMTQTRRLRMYGKGAMRRWDGRGRVGVLHVLHHSDGTLTAGELARACHVTSARMAQTLNQLEADGLVTRAPSEADRRRTNVRMTDAGEAELRSYFDGVTHFTAGLLRELGEKDSRELVRILGKLADVLREAEGNVGPDAPTDARCADACGAEGGDAHEAR